MLIHHGKQPKNKDEQHIEKQHKQFLMEEKSKSSVDGKMVFNCEVDDCLSYFVSRKGLRQHFGKVHAEKRFLCGICLAKFGLERDLKYHQKSRCFLLKKGILNKNEMVVAIQKAETGVNTKHKLITIKDSSHVNQCSQTETTFTATRQLFGVNEACVFSNINQATQSSACQTIVDWEQIIKEMPSSPGETCMEDKFKLYESYVEQCLLKDRITDDFISFLTDDGTQTTEPFD
uniref:C2H2-type domain-containing protein n=1 Tax=Rhabditophanes sp. KR3021 TaxID=114890 RepID=A0AC35UCP8_9BILA